MMFKLHVVIGVTGMQRENQTLFASFWPTLLVFQIMAAGSAKIEQSNVVEVRRGRFLKKPTRRQG